MTPPQEYANYLSFLGFDEIQEPYIITAGTKVLRFHPVGAQIPDLAYDWNHITMALEWGLLLRSFSGRKDLSAAKHVISSLACECGIWLERFPTEEKNDVS